MPTASEQIAHSYLQHMLLAARVRDKSKGLWRNLFDNWFAYKKGHPFVSHGGDGQPRWFNRPNAAKKCELLYAMHYRSQLADETIRERREEELAVDHVVPISTMRDKMIEQVSSWEGLDDVSRFLNTWYRLCVVTTEEHRALHETGQNAFEVTSENILSRYKSAGISLIITGSNAGACGTATPLLP